MLSGPAVYVLGPQQILMVPSTAKEARSFRGGELPLSATYPRLCSGDLFWRDSQQYREANYN
jgi:hypothetical protein